MDIEDVFQSNFEDDNGRLFRIIRLKDGLNVMIDGKLYFEGEVPFILEKEVAYLFGIYDCIQTCNGTELKIFFSNKEHRHVAMIGVINANLCRID